MLKRGNQEEQQKFQRSGGAWPSTLEASRRLRSSEASGHISVDAARAIASFATPPEGPPPPSAAYGGPSRSGPIKAQVEGTQSQKAGNHAVGSPRIPAFLASPRVTGECALRRFSLHPRAP